MIEAVGVLTVGVVIDWLIFPEPPAFNVTLVVPVSSPPRLMAPLFTLGPGVVVVRLIVAAVITAESVIELVVGEVPAVPLALIENAVQFPLTDPEAKVSVLLDT